MATQNPGLDIDNSRSYATEENLDKALVKMGINNIRHMVVRNREGRFTAIFSGHDVMADATSLPYIAGQCCFKVFS